MLLILPGVVLGYPVIGARLRLHSIACSSSCPPALVTSSVIKCTRSLLQQTNCQLMEPMMKVEVGYLHMYITNSL